MEAKDTVMDILEILKAKYLASRTNSNFEQLNGLEKLDAQDTAIAEAQAEISFKAGKEEQAREDKPLIANVQHSAFVEGKLAGIERGWEQAEAHYHIDTG